MEFVPAGEIIEDVQVRTVTIAENPYRQANIPLWTCTAPILRAIAERQ
jgi:uncharacterized cupin superfamily protein